MCHTAAENADLQLPLLLQSSKRNDEARSTGRCCRSLRHGHRQVCSSSARELWGLASAGCSDQYWWLAATLNTSPDLSLSSPCFAGAYASDGRCGAAVKVASAPLAQAATGPNDTKSSRKQVFMTPSNRAVTSGVVVASAQEAADALPYGTPQEFDFDTPLGKGKWSIAAAQDGKLFFTAKASACGLSANSARSACVCRCCSNDSWHCHGMCAQRACVCALVQCTMRVLRPSSLTVSPTVALCLHPSCSGCDVCAAAAAGAVQACCRHGRLCVWLGARRPTGSAPWYAQALHQRG